MIKRVTCKWSILNFSILTSIRYDWWQKCFIFPLEIVYFKGNLLLDDRIIFILVVTFKNFLCVTLFCFIVTEKMLYQRNIYRKVKIMAVLYWILWMCLFLEQYLCGNGAASLIQGERRPAPALLIEAVWSAPPHALADSGPDSVPSQPRPKYACWMFCSEIREFPNK